MSKNIPEGFTPVEDGLPTEDKPVLAVREAATMSARYEVVTARHQPGYRPRAPWRDMGGDAITDSGSEVLGWRYADEWLQATA